MESLPNPVGGRPAHVLTDAIRREVEINTAALIPQEDIAALCGISRPTPQKYYLDDWVRGKAKAARRVAFRLNTLLEQDNEKAILHLAKVKLGLTETCRHEHEVSGKDGDLLTIRDYSDGASSAASCARCTTGLGQRTPADPDAGGIFSGGAAFKSPGVENLPSPLGGRPAHVGDGDGTALPGGLPLVVEDE